MERQGPAPRRRAGAAASRPEAHPRRDLRGAAADPHHRLGHPRQPAGPGHHHRHRAALPGRAGSPGRGPRHPPRSCALRRPRLQPHRGHRVPGELRRDGDRLGHRRVPHRRRLGGSGGADSAHHPRSRRRRGAPGIPRRHRHRPARPELRQLARIPPLRHPDGAFPARQGPHPRAVRGRVRVPRAGGPSHPLRCPVRGDHRRGGRPQHRLPAPVHRRRRSGARRRRRPARRPPAGR